MAQPRPDFSHLSVAERIQLVEELLESIADAPEVLEVTEAQKAELDRRLEAHRADPDSAIPWETVRSELLQRP